MIKWLDDLMIEVLWVLQWSGIPFYLVKWLKWCHNFINVELKWRNWANSTSNVWWNWLQKIVFAFTSRSFLGEQAPIAFWYLWCMIFSFNFHVYLCCLRQIISFIFNFKRNILSCIILLLHVECAVRFQKKFHFETCS